MSDFDEIIKSYVASNTGLSVSVLDKTAKLFTPKDYKKGDYFSKQGDYSNTIGFVCGGVFTMYVLREDGSWFTKTFLTNNDFLLATFDVKEKSTINIQAVTKATVLEADYTEIQKLFSAHPELDQFAKREIEKVLESTYSKLEQFAVLDAGDRYRVFREEFGHIESHIPQYMIASYLGITPTQLSRIRKHMKS